MGRVSFQALWYRGFVRVSVQVCAALCWLCASGFSWPGRSARLVKELTADSGAHAEQPVSALSPRDKREALRLLRALYNQAEREPAVAEADLTALLHDADPEVRLDALRLVALVHDDPAPWRLAHDDVAPRVRAAAVDALAAVGDFDAALASVDDPDASVRGAAQRALALSSDARVTPSLVRGLSDSVSEVRVAAAHGLSQRREPAALAALLRYVDDPLPELRAAVLDALAGQTDLRADAALAVGLDDPDGAVVLTALRGFLRRPERALPGRVFALMNEANTPQIAAAARLLAARAAQLAEPPTGAARTDPAWLLPLELTADRALTLAESERALSQLERLLPHEQPLATDALVEWLGHAPLPLQVRIAALVERSGGPIDTELLVRLLRAADPARRAVYVRLFAQARANDSSLRSRARGRASTLTRPGAHWDEAPILLSLLDDDSAAVRDAAVFALSTRPNERRWAALVSHYPHARGPMRLYALRAVAAGLPSRSHQTARERRSTEHLSAALADDLHSDDDARASLALSVLGELGTEQARSLVRGELAAVAAGRRIAALRASVADRGQAAVSARRGLIEATDPRVAASAIVALALAGDPLPLSWLLSQIDRAPWPIGPAASFALAGAVLHDQRDAAAVDLCPLLASHEPVTRHNLRLAWSHRQTRCGGAAPIPIGAPRGGEALQTLSAAFARTPTGGLGHVRVFWPLALLLQDSRLLVSWPDADGLVDWPRTKADAYGHAWPDFYASP